MSCCLRSVSADPSVSLKIDDFGSFTDKDGQIKDVKRFTWVNSNKVTVQILNYGGTIVSIKAPDKKGNIEDIVLGFDTLDGYRATNAHFGATIGRVANRIAKGQLTIEGVDYQLAINDPPNHLHGGLRGFDKVLWNYYVTGTKVILTYLSKDLEENYPGDVLATVTFELTADDEFQVDYKAVVSKPTVVNLTNHSYFNLGGHASGSEGVYNHKVTINADRYTEVDETSIPTGNLPTVSGTVFDLRIPRLLKDIINKVPNSPGFDHNFCITKTPSEDVVFVAKAQHVPSGRVLEVYTNQPGVQFYTANNLPEDDSTKGKGGAIYQKHGAVCFETQNYPDAVHHANFPKMIYYPGEKYHYFTSFKFSVEN